MNKNSWRNRRRNSHILAIKTLPLLKCTILWQVITNRIYPTIIMPFQPPNRSKTVRMMGTRQLKMIPSWQPRELSASREILLPTHRAKAIRLLTCDPLMFKINKKKSCRGRRKISSKANSRNSISRRGPCWRQIPLDCLSPMPSTFKGSSFRKTMEETPLGRIGANRCIMTDSNTYLGSRRIINNNTSI